MQDARAFQQPSHRWANWNIVSRTLRRFADQVDMGLAQRSSGSVPRMSFGAQAVLRERLVGTMYTENALLCCTVKDNSELGAIFATCLHAYRTPSCRSSTIETRIQSQDLLMLDRPISIFCHCWIAKLLVLSEE